MSRKCWGFGIKLNKLMTYIEYVNIIYIDFIIASRRKYAVCTFCLHSLSLYSYLVKNF